SRLDFFRLLGDLNGDGEVDDQDLAVAPTVTCVRLNEGDTSDAQVHSITFHFSGQVSLNGSAFDLVRRNGDPVGLVVSSTEVDGQTVAVLTFTGDDLIDGALPDGAYTLTIHGEQIHNSLGQVLGHDFAGDQSVDFFGADGSDQSDLVGLFHPTVVIHAG